MLLSRNTKNIRVFLSGKFLFFYVKFSIYLNRRVSVMRIVPGRNTSATIDVNVTKHKSQRQKTYLRICAPSEDSDQPAHSRSMIIISTGHFLHSHGWKVSSCGQQRFWSGCKTDLNIRCAHMSKSTVNPQWLEHRWLVYLGSFELAFMSLLKFVR